MTPNEVAPQAKPHIPVLLDEVIDALAITPGETHVDGTFGAGGYSMAMIAAGAKVYGFDQDPDAIASGQSLVAASDGKLILHHGYYSQMADVLDGEDIDGVTLDIGVSSMQLDQAERGFSFQKDGPLDMRMSQDGPSAADFLNEADEEEIADVIYRYGEERRSRKIAKAIVNARPLTRTSELASVVRKALGQKPGDKKDPATRTFQAIRIHINRELGELEDGLVAAERLLKPGGRLAIVTFHSLEDRIVKNFLRDRSGQKSAGSRHLPQVSETRPAPTFHKPAKLVRPAGAEQVSNPRARSATLRSAVRSDAPSHAKIGGVQ
ncbi:16S rRNA (cytosine(1402)-N(4))-methyltransferase RsmH [Sphingorhabdus sp. EL138]|jgi:16S rRNA (cytosine1402-N4)-methyltransferase|uniref:16S rRNA (cytosine(1402)-N(4))-methyltransferase RsmH n=1 Tax=Sphingorhabdus sp. EL138 TaxID=2073156 RepID=UPI000D68F1CD|nr:16S rRNA (cytosine(1402)-N(4))-methyltransferase RsmH [Sphingorhabdus sp. EL138]